MRPASTAAGVDGSAPSPTDLTAASLPRPPVLPSFTAWWRAAEDGVKEGLFYFPQAEAQLTVFSQVGGQGQLAGWVACGLQAWPVLPRSSCTGNGLRHSAQ